MTRLDRAAWVEIEKLSLDQIETRVAAGALPQYVSPRSASQVLPIHMDRLYEEVSCGQIRAAKIGNNGSGHRWRIPLTDLVRWWRAQFNVDSDA